MTKHTDTSRIADLRFQVSEKMPINHSDLSCLFDRIEALEAALRTLINEHEVLGFVGGPSAEAWDAARAALGEKQ